MAFQFRFAIVPLLAIAPLFMAGSARSSYPSLSPAEYRALTHLAYPQSRRAMISRFGSPVWQGDDYDYYPVGSNAIARIAYVGNRAQFVEFLVEGDRR